MLEFVLQLKNRNQTLFYYGIVCLLSSVVFIALTNISEIQVLGVNAWYKPFKFAFSTFLFSWTMAWYCYYLKNFKIRFFNWSVIVLLSFEIIYIAFQASKQELSHFNISTPLYVVLYSCMAIAASLVTLYTAYVGFLFFRDNFNELPQHYLCAIRISILIFVIFSFQGFLMGSRLNHSVGGNNENSNIFILGWSKTVGDLRVAHFMGMHALQIIPITSFYLLKNVKRTICFSFLYLLITTYTLLQALNSMPFFTI